MKQKINKLTPLQEQALKDTYSEWLAIGRSCAALDQTAATAAIGDLYEAIGEKRPVVLYFSSPIMCILAYRVLSKTKLGDQLGGQLWGQLHNSNGAAVAYSDGWAVWALNGVRMTEAHVMTPAEKLDATVILKETNVEIRRELIRKVGVEMMLAHLPHKVLDKQGDYELLRIDFPDLAQDTRYLKMLNPSIGVWHLEGVERKCNTVQEAINWRAATFGQVQWQPSQFT